jgi:hypothetical protein
MNTITTSQAADLIRTSGGQWVGVTFTKRSDGSTREMTFRLGVRAYLKGGSLAFSPAAK